MDDVSVVVNKEDRISKYLESGVHQDLDVDYLVQHERDGLGSAVKIGKQKIGDEPFAVILGDGYFSSKNILKELKNLHQRTGAKATLTGFKVDDKSSYGIIEKQGLDVKDVVEKPDPDKTESNIAIAGAYIFESEIFEALEKLDSGKQGEYQLTDAIRVLIEKGEKVVCKEIEGKYIDVGTPERLKAANKIEIGLDS